MIDPRPKCQLRVTAKELMVLLRATHEPRRFSANPVARGMGGERWTTEDEHVNAAVKVLAPDLAAEVGHDPLLFQVVVVRPAWLLTTGEVKRWTYDPLPEDS